MTTATTVAEAQIAAAQAIALVVPKIMTGSPDPDSLQKLLASAVRGLEATTAKITRVSHEHTSPSLSFPAPEVPSEDDPY